jgi:tRNA modification GTPase
LFPNDRSTIFARASGLGKAAIAIFRISGPECSAALGKLAPGAEFPVRRPVLRMLHQPASLEPIDRAIVTRFEAPASFTGEDTAELSVTGGLAVSSAIAQALTLIPGLRPAEPGEFARRAFINGKIDLCEVEGLADLVNAETEAQRRQAQRIAGGALSRECEAIRTPLLEARAAIEAQIDFADVEDADKITLETVKHVVRLAANRIDRALSTALAAERLREGFVVVIAGPPNVGKSTLMNLLAGRDIAITSPFAGTTRDPIEVHLDLRGYPVTLVDTAGIRDTDDPVEREGVYRATQRAQNADLTLWLSDQSASEFPRVECKTLMVRTKVDQWSGGFSLEDRSHFAISARTGQGIVPLLDAIGRLAEEDLKTFEPAVLTVERHRHAFQHARDSLSLALAPSATELELIAEDLRSATSALDRVMGRIGVEDVLSEIFSRLCIGK